MSDKKTILIVDDDHDFILQQKVQLETMGYQVITAYGHDEAVELLEEARPDMAIVDLMMENVDSGFQLSYHVKKRFPGMPIVMVTALTGETGVDFDSISDYEKQWIKADVLLTKPVRYEQLQREVERLLP